MRNKISEDILHYTKIFFNMLEVIDFELVKHEDGYGLVDKQGGNFGDIESDRYTNASQIIDRLDIYLNDFYFDDLEEAAESEYGITFKYQPVPSSAEEWITLMDKHEEFKKAYRHEYDVMDLIAFHAQDVDLEKVVIQSDETLRYTKIFLKMLGFMEFRLIKDENGYGLEDHTGANWGDIEDDRFDNASEIVDRMDIYFEDYYFCDLGEAATEEYDVDTSSFSAVEWVSFMNEHEDFKQHRQHDFEVMDLLAYHLNDVNLEKIIEGVVID